MATQQRQREDTEITLGTGKILLLFFALSAICAVFFAMGCLFGKNSARAISDSAPAQTTGMSVHADALKPSATPAKLPPSSSAGQKDTDSKPPVSQLASADTSAASEVPTSAVATDPAPVSVPTNGYFVQVAAVSKQEDADALIDALKKKQYPAFLPDASPDKLFHVQIGPFTDIKDAEALRARLLNDGYNPIIKR